MGTSGATQDLSLNLHQCHQFGLEPYLWCSATKRQATVLQSTRTSPTGLICGKILASSTHTSLMLAELQLTSTDEGHKTSAPNTTLSSRHFLLKEKGKAELPCVPMLVTSVQGCAENTARRHPAGLPTQNYQQLQPVHNTHPTLLSPHHLPKTLSHQLHALDRSLMRSQMDARVREERLHFIHTFSLSKTCLWG